MRASFFFLILFAAGPAFARPDTTKMRCRDATALVDQNGAIVLGTGYGTFNKFYKYGQVRAYVPTLDNPSCAIGYVEEASTGGRGGGGGSWHPDRPAPACKDGTVRVFHNGNARGFELGLGTDDVTAVCVHGQWKLQAN